LFGPSASPVARIDCPNCGVHVVNVPWAQPGSSFTLLFEAFVITLVTAMPVAAAAHLIGEHNTCLWRVVLHYVEKAAACVGLADLRRIAIDETVAKRGHITLLSIIDARKAAPAARFADHVDDHNWNASRIKQLPMGHAAMDPEQPLVVSRHAPIFTSASSLPQ